MDASDKFFENYNFLKDNIYLSNKDLPVGGGFNAALLLGMLSSVLNGKTLLVGEYGLGKTTLAESITSLVTSTPRNIVSSNSLKGHPELNHEQLIGRPDLGKLNQGTEKVIWSNFVNADYKIVDEINRIPEAKQNILLTGMQSNNWLYLNESLNKPSSFWFATKNYRDEGNNSLIPPLLDRFDLAIESKNPGMNISRLLRSHSPPDIDAEHIKKEDFSNFLKEEYGLNTLTQSDKKVLSEEINNKPFSKDANLFFDVLVSELASCQVYGQKRTVDNCPDGCHYKNYACFDTKNTLSVRSVKAIDTYAKALAWVDGSDDVNVKHLSLISPYATWHKTPFNNDITQKSLHGKREDSFQQHLMYKTVNGIKLRFDKTKNKQEEMINYIMSGEDDKARELAEKMDHPVFKEYLK